MGQFITRQSIDAGFDIGISPRPTPFRDRPFRRAYIRRLSEIDPHEDAVAEAARQPTCPASIGDRIQRNAVGDSGAEALQQLYPSASRFLSSANRRGRSQAAMGLLRAQVRAAASTAAILVNFLALVLFSIPRGGQGVGINRGRQPTALEHRLRPLATATCAHRRCGDRARMTFSIERTGPPFRHPRLGIRILPRRRRATKMC